MKHSHNTQTWTMSLEMCKKIEKNVLLNKHFFSRKLVFVFYILLTVKLQTGFVTKLTH